MKNPTLQFAWANAKYLLSGKLRTPEGNTPRPNHIVPTDFSCIGVATSANPETDDYIIAQLKTLAIKRVRLDFTYHDTHTYVARFLKALIEAEFIVHLHLIQPFDQAQKMETGNAMRTWEDFVVEVCRMFGADVALIEVGSTINRKRWAGYTLQGFLNMWGIAYKVIKSRNILLAGPSITDFEPLYNVGLLSILQSRNQLPDIHTDNLFSERCTEPERDDHKILGRRLAKLGQFRLVKKAFILEKIGKHFGAPILHSPSAFWTLPRIGRLLPDTLQKQADYLSRYMILTAASGALQSAAWGPLICHREGLIDDGIEAYPKLERITHYQSANKAVSHYALRPAFKAYQAFNARIPGTHYIGRQNQHDCLEVHAFKSNQHIVHALWTTNAKAAAMIDVYTQADMSGATAFDRDGNAIEMPSMIIESPIYIHFPSNKTLALKSTANVIKSLSVHAHIEDLHFHAYRQNEWRGVIAAKDAPEAALLSTALDPSRIQKPSKSTVLRQARNAIWTIEDPRDPTKKLVVKQPVKVPWFKKITDRYKPSKGLRSWNGANELLRRGVENATPIAYFEHRSDDTRTQNYFICEYVPSDFSAREIFSSFASGESHFQGITQQRAYAQVVDYLFKMHSRGVFFRDLSGGNILMRKTGKDNLTFSLIDTGRAHFFNHGTVLSKRFSDMARACNKLHAEGRNELMTMYMQKMVKTFGLKQKLPFLIYNAKVIIKRNTKLKNIRKRLGLKKKA